MQKCLQCNAMLRQLLLDLRACLLTIASHLLIYKSVRLYR